MRRWAVVVVCLIVGCDRPAPFASDGPIRVQPIVQTNPPLHAVVAKIDLTDPRVQVVICPGGPDPDGPGPWETILRTPSDIARENHLDLAINGGYFAHLAPIDDPTKYSAGDPARAENLVMIDGKIVTAQHSGYSLGIDAKNHATIGKADDVLATHPQFMISGSAQIVVDGQAVVSAKCNTPAPRTAVGLSEDGRTLILLVVDGRRPEWGLGLTDKALAEEMIRLGAFNAIELDGGGSSAMVSKSEDGRYRVLNRPSDGSTLPIPLSVERPVPYVLGIRLR